MKFTLDGAEYWIEFERHYRKVRTGWDEKKKESILSNSKFPYTTVTIWKHDLQTNQISALRTGTVGVWHKDQINPKHGLLEGSRLRVLRYITKDLDRDMRKAIWDCYVNEKKTQREIARKQRAAVLEGMKTQVYKPSPKEVVALVKYEGAKATSQPAF